MTDQDDAQSGQEQYVTLFGAAVYTGKEPHELIRIYSSGSLPAASITDDGMAVFKVADLDAFMEAGKASA